MSFFDWGPNPDAGNRPGRLAFAGDNWGAASAGVDYPEQLWNGGWGPRIGIAYALNDKTVIRTGYGIFYTQAFYPGWGGGVDQTGFNTSGTLEHDRPGRPRSGLLLAGRLPDRQDHAASVHRSAAT